MNKKAYIIHLVFSHLFCILLGYYIAMIHPTFEIVEISTEKTIETVSTGTTGTEEVQTIANEKQAEESAAADKIAEPVEDTQSEKPMETAPVYTQPSATQPSVTELPGTQPTNPNLGENEMPPVIRGD